MHRRSLTSGCSGRAAEGLRSAKGSWQRTNPTSGTLAMVFFSHAPTPPPPLCSARTTTPARPHTCRRCRAASGAHSCSAIVADDSRPTAAACIAVALTEVVRDRTKWSFLTSAMVDAVSSAKKRRCARL
jgi:hypothetical protein